MWKSGIQNPQVSEPWQSDTFHSFNIFIEAYCVIGVNTVENPTLLILTHVEFGLGGRHRPN